ncbi:translation initiation factor IF-3 [Roseibacillus ishigakijimensis]|uniref:Translation initiation factor IF-3 n=1 Tax=Roseibacillus ishigakijimensis TaxID=454146 RepID=A0A934RSN6_9BACT|nr:translation initiation factor IF-3 [Roseibacillus ishigakijimensis]
MIRVNDKIRASRVRVLAPDGAQLGVMDLRDAVKAAKSVGLTLVEVAGNVDPPVCQIVDYGKWRYDQSKRKKNKDKTTTKMKEVKFRVRTEEHDYNIKMGRLEEFLDAGHKVRVQLQFRGRENAHKELGVEVLKRVKEDVKQMGHCDQEPRIAGRAVNMVLSPLPKGQRKRRFKLIHGDLIDPDEDYEDDDEDYEDDDHHEDDEHDSSDDD